LHEIVVLNTPFCGENYDIDTYYLRTTFARCIGPNLIIHNALAMFFGSIFLCSQSGDDPHEYLAKFGYMLNMKEKFCLSIFLLHI
jgi:hypothetical protein